MNALISSSIQPTAGVYRPAAFAASGPNPELAVQHPGTIDLENETTVSDLVEQFLDFDPDPLLDYARTLGLTRQSLLSEQVGAYDRVAKIIPADTDKRTYEYLYDHLPSAICDRDILTTAHHEISEMTDSPHNADRALSLLIRLPNYLRLVLIYKLWTEVDPYGFFPPPTAFAAMLKFLHSNTKHVSLVVANFGLHAAEDMFDIAADGIEGFYLNGDTSRPIFDNWECQRVYRGGHSDPDNLAMGMSWSLSIEEARRFAQRSIWGDGPRVVLATDAPKDDVLGVFDYEQEVVLRPHPRQYEIVEYVTS